MKSIVIGYDQKLKKEVRKIEFAADELPKVQLFNSNDVIYGNPMSNLAVAFIYSWSSDTAPDEIREIFTKTANYAALTGFWRTTNGAKYVFANILANPNINKLLLLVFGQRDNGHLLVDALSNFWQYGVNNENIIINSNAPNPKFEQIPLAALERLREQCDLVVARSLSADFSKIERIMEALIQEPENAVKAESVEAELYSKTDGKMLYDDGARFPQPFKIDLLHLAQNVEFEEKSLDTAVGQSVQANDLDDALAQMTSFVFRNGTMMSDQRGIITVECRSLTITVLDPLSKIPQGFSAAYLGKYVDEFMNGGERSSEFTYTYHERIFRKWGNQVEKIIALLRKHPNTRRATISLWDSGHDIDNDSSPCLDFLWFVVRNKRLELHAVYRSHHLATVTKDGKLMQGEGAFVPNVYALAKLQQKVAEDIGMERGPTVITDLSGHLYVSNV